MDKYISPHSFPHELHFSTGIVVAPSFSPFSTHAPALEKLGCIYFSLLTLPMSALAGRDPNLPDRDLVIWFWGSEEIKIWRYRGRDLGLDGDRDREI